MFLLLIDPKTRETTWYAPVKMSVDITSHWIIPGEFSLRTDLIGETFGLSWFTPVRTEYNRDRVPENRIFATLDESRKHTEIMVVLSDEDGKWLKSQLPSKKGQLIAAVHDSVCRHMSKHI